MQNDGYHRNRLGKLSSSATGTGGARSEGTRLDRGSGGSENKRPLPPSDRPSFAKRGAAGNLQRGSGGGASSSSTSPRSTLDRGPETAAAGKRSDQGRGGTSSAYHEARGLYRTSSNVGRGAPRNVAKSASSVGRKEKKPQQNPFSPIAAMWDDIYRWCGSWCGQAPRDALSEDVDELNTKLDRLQAHCEKLAADNELIKEQNEKLKDNVRLLHSSSMAKGSGGANARSSGAPKGPAAQAAEDDPTVPKGRGPVRKGDIVGTLLFGILGGPKAR